MNTVGKWAEGVGPGTPLSIASRLVLEPRLVGLPGAMDGALGDPTPERVHQLRVGCRRAEAALDAFAHCLDERRVRRLRKRIKRARRTAGTARDCDVHRAMFLELAKYAQGDQRAVVEFVLRSIAEERQQAERQVRRVGQRANPKELRRRAKRLIESAHTPEAGDRPLVRTAATAIARLAGAVRDASETDLREPANLHVLRIRGKRLRYAIELFAPCFPGRLREEIYPKLEQMQERLGSVNDIGKVVERLRALLEHPAVGVVADGGSTSLRAGLEDLLDRYRAIHRRRLDEALAALSRGQVPAIVEDLQAIIAGEAPAAPVPAQRNGHAAVGTVDSDAASRRLAAIDVGTNSIRLLVAEAHEDGTYRVLDDEKETARLGSGLERTGTLSQEAMARAAEVVARMKKIADGYGARQVRIIGTSACRDASNRDEFAAMVADKAGLPLEIISPEEEARLAYLSVAHAFDLQGVSSAVIDIGGGSTEVVLSAGGVTEAIYSLKLGAVRLTDRFGGPKAAAGKRYRSLRRHVEEAIAGGIADVPLRPQVVIGTGGTFTTLANILLHRRHGPGGPSLWDREVPGFEAKRAEIRHVLDHLRDLDERGRARVPGLPAERADIIVAGLTILERMLRHLGVNMVRVHDRGIRDGLVLTMAGELFGSSRSPGAPGRQDAMVAVRRFADSCRYEQAHSEHVTRLALSIYDQLVSLIGGPAPEPGDDGWATAASRRLLEAAAVLHDVGYLVNYERHHRHSYHLIVHSDLRRAGFSRRDIDVIAAVTRYHRQAEPKVSHAEFAPLSEPDRELVRRLTGILRIADGLDRTHTQSIRSVSVQIRGREAVFTACGGEDPATDLWGAERKSGLFKQAFGLTPVIDGRAEPLRPAPPAQREEAERSEEPVQVS